MKKLILLFVSSLILVSCDIDDDGPTTLLTAAEVIDADLPEFFEPGETYEIDVTYLLPSACHIAVGLDAHRGGTSGDEFRKIYITGVASYDANVTECNEEDEDLEREDSFEIKIGTNEDEPYTFFLWTGVDVDGENIYTEIVVPVGGA